MCMIIMKVVNMVDWWERFANGHDVVPGHHITFGYDTRWCDKKSVIPISNNNILKFKNSKIIDL